MSLKEEGINIDDLRQDIEHQHNRLLHAALTGGAATLDELVDVVGNMSQMMQVINDLATAVFQLRGQK